MFKSATLVVKYDVTVEDRGHTQTRCYKINDQKRLSHQAGCSDWDLRRDCVIIAAFTEALDLLRARGPAWAVNVSCCGVDSLLLPARVCLGYGDSSNS